MKEPSYIEINNTGELDERIQKLMKILESCYLCPRKCGINRLQGENGFCKSGKEPIVSSYGPHYGEEDPLVGTGGSGTIFLTHCNLGCVYCQNYEISQLGYGTVRSVVDLARYMIELQEQGCCNINFVTPTHFAPQLVNATKLAADKGLKIPLVWNCGGYESIEVIRLLEDIVDIYMPDIKYGEGSSAKKYSEAANYFENAKLVVKEIHRQVGDLKINSRGIAYRGLLIRHLVLPNQIAGTEEILRFIAEEISRDSYVNVMGQYRPMGKAWKHKELNRNLTRKEFNGALTIALKLGLNRGLNLRNL